ncbi:hypothetical protein D3C76_42310 [compost metagenome]
MAFFRCSYVNCKRILFKAESDGVIKTYSDYVLIRSYAREAIATLGNIYEGLSLWIVLTG